MLQESRNDCAFFQLKKTPTKQQKNTPYKNQNRTRKMDPAKQLVTVWNVTVRDVVLLLVSKCSESGSVESAIENRFNRQCQTNVTMYFFSLTGLAGKVENRSDTMILFTRRHKTFHLFTTKKLYLLFTFSKICFKGYQSKLYALTESK